ncbi:MAG TPA: dienelactone hydrolase family protein [Bryobacteraceae bacterium]|nr:dienelactone hydrolase family protein [Bryobacteraceae bacterium]
MTNAVFDPGPFAVETRTLHAHDAARNRTFPVDLWQPANAGPHPLILYSHASLQHRRAATFLTTHLASHGYRVAAMDHSEIVAPELARKEVESDAERAARMDALIASRLPDIQFLLDFMVQEFPVDASRIGIVGHSFGGWTALQSAGADRRIRAVVAHAAGGGSNPKPGILPLRLTYQWDAPTLYLVAENDACLPLEGMQESFEKTRAPKLMVILRRADHLHFMDHFAELHENFRTMAGPPVLAPIQQEMLPVAELCSEPQAHLFTRGLTLAHLDAVLRDNHSARDFLAGDIAAELASRGVDAIVRRT